MVTLLLAAKLLAAYLLWTPSWEHLLSPFLGCLLPSLLSHTINSLGEDLHFALFLQTLTQ